MLSVGCLSCPVCNVRALWSNGWTDQDETWMHVGLVRGQIVLDGDPAPPPPKDQRSPPIFGPYRLLPNGCIDQDPLGMEVGLGPGRLFVRWGSHSPSPKRGRSPPKKIFGPCWPNGWMVQDNNWHGGRPQRRRPCGVRWGPSPLPQKGAESPANIWPISIVTKRLDAPICHLVRS